MMSSGKTILFSIFYVVTNSEFPILLITSQVTRDLIKWTILRERTL